jgi:hypothetical protein
MIRILAFITATHHCTESSKQSNQAGKTKKKASKMGKQKKKIYSHMT